MHCQQLFAIIKNLQQIYFKNQRWCYFLFRERINELFKERNCSIVAFADEIGITRQSLTFYLNGDRFPDFPTLQKICQSLNVSADWLLGFSDVRSPSSDIKTACNALHISENTAQTIAHLQEFDVYKPVDLLFEPGEDLDYAFTLLSEYSCLRKIGIKRSLSPDPVPESDGSIRLPSHTAAAFFIQQFCNRIEELLMINMNVCLSEGDGE